MAPAVAKAAEDSGIARVSVGTFEDYRDRLEHLVSRRLELMRGIIDRAKENPKRIVFPEGEEDKILRAAKILVDQGLAHPILLARRDQIAGKLAELGLPEDKITIVHNESSPQYERYARRFHDQRRREGVTLEDGYKRMRSRNYFGSMMVAEGDADGLISGLTYEYADTIRPALQVIHTRKGVNRVAGAYT